MFVKSKHLKKIKEQTNKKTSLSAARWFHCGFLARLTGFRVVLAEAFHFFPCCVMGTF